MNNMDELFPSIKRNIESLIEDEDGGVPGKKLLFLGTIIVVLGSLMSMDAFAGHSSHSSHRSHSSHSSGSHGNSHSNHGSHESHQSHTSHGNTYSHSNSRFSSEGDVSSNAPSASSIPKISGQTVTSTTDTFKLPDINQDFKVPNETPDLSTMPSIAIPVPSTQTQMDIDAIHIPSDTDTI